MAGIDGHALWRFADVIRGAMPKQEQPDRTTARLSYVDDEGVGWYRIDGSDIDTPCAGGEASEVEVGQLVDVELRGGLMYVTGNEDAPSVGAEHVTRAVAPALSRATQAVRESVIAQKLAAETRRIAEAVNQHFWHDSNGAHVTEVTQDEWGTEATGHNILLNSYGLLLRNALNWLASFTESAVTFYDGVGNAVTNVVARFGTDGAQIGRSGESHVELDYRSLQLVDRDSNTYFHVSDLRDESGLYETVDTSTGNGTKKLFPLSFKASSRDYTVKVDGVEVTSGVSKEYYQVVFTTAPSDGAVVTVEYATTSKYAKAYTLGVRAADSKVGPMSFAEGFDVTASGQLSHAEGSNTQSTNTECHAEGASTVASGLTAHSEGIYTVASGSYSHAQNVHTIAAKLSQTVLGTYNVEDTATTTTHPDGFRDHGAYALIIGNGKANARSNALTVGWDGSVWSAGGAELQDVVTVYSPTIADNTTYDANVGGNGVQFYNADDSYIGQVRAYARSGADRIRGLQIGGKNEASTAYNYLYLMVDKDGNRLVQVSEVAPWLDMLGITPSDTTMTINTTNTTSIGNNNVRRSGKVVTIQFTELKIANAVANNTATGTLATIPSGYRPSWNVYFPLVRTTNAGSSYYRIDSSGNLIFRNVSGAQIAAGATFAGTITYIIA